MSSPDPAPCACDSLRKRVAAEAISGRTQGDIVLGLERALSRVTGVSVRRGTETHREEKVR